MVLKSSFYEKLAGRKFDILLFLSLAGAGLKYTFNIERIIDIHLYDESDYLYQGINLIYSGALNSQWAPVYSFWYFILSIIESDPIDIYYLNFRILTVVLPVLLFTVLRKFEVPRLPSFLASYFILLSSGNLLNVPKVSHFAITVILISIIISSFWKDPNHRWLTIAAGALISSYIRPELFITFAIFLSIYIYRVINEKSFYREARALMVFSVIVITVISVFGIPVANESRSFLAFRQHFSLNWVKWNASPLSPWTDSRKITYENFGDAENIYEAMISNSGMFFRHISENINSFTTELSDLKSHATVLFPQSYRFQKLELRLFTIIMLLYSLYNIIIRKERIPDYLKRNLKKRKILLLACLGYIIPVLISIILIYPRKHYLFILLILMVMPLMALLYPPWTEKSNNWRIRFSALLVVSVMIIILTPHSSKLHDQLRPQEAIHIVKYLRSLGIKAKVNILEAGGGYNIYAGSNYKRVAQYEKNCAFDKFLIQRKINMIILSDDLISDSRFHSDPSWYDFLKNFKSYNFQKVRIPYTHTYIYVKNTYHE